MLSIIIPVLNEAQTLPYLLKELNSMLAGSIKSEILVCDGQSTDATAIIAAKSGARVIHCPQRGRAAQMNEGAKHARGDILYFLHADTLPPPGFCRHIEHALEKGAEAGCFRLTFDDPSPVLRFYSWFTRFGSQLIRFGDQSLFVRRDVWHSTGGFRNELMVMEDYDLASRLIKQHRFVVLPEPVVTSARKYHENGLIRLQLIFTMVWLLYMAGVSQKVLVHFYRTHIR
jgi:rSAM/selenodomain-associated transferase 2